MNIKLWAGITAMCAGLIVQSEKVCAMKHRRTISECPTVINKIRHLKLMETNFDLRSREESSLIFRPRPIRLTYLTSMYLESNRKDLDDMRCKSLESFTNNKSSCFESSDEKDLDEIIESFSKMKI